MNNEQLRDAILTYLGRHPNEGFKSRQLRRRLSVGSEKDFQTLRALLHDMVDDGTLHWTKKQGYHIPATSNRITGVLKIDKRGAGTVTTSRGDIAVDKRSLGTAFNGDTVEAAVFVSKKERGHRPPGVIGEGEVLKVLTRAHTQFGGTLQRSKNFYFVLPDDPTVQRDFYVAPDDLNGAASGDKVLVELLEWDDPFKNPEGRIVSTLGAAGDPFVELRSVLQTYRLSTTFPKEVEQAAAAIPSTIPAEVIRQRLDLRDVAVLTIDPHDAKDFDDALSVEVMEGGSYRIGVHIADVSHYVTEGSVIDREAYTRATSVYLANQVIPMLPEKLSNNICSLVPHQDRLTYSVFMHVTANGRVRKYEFARSVINSKRRFTYEEAEKALDTRIGEYAEELNHLWDAAKILRRKRMKNGSIDFDSPEAKFHYDEKGKPVDIYIKQRLKSNQLVEECMLLANQTVAAHIATLEKDLGKLPFVYRVHDLPDKEKLRSLEEFVRKFGHSLNVSQSSSSKDLQKLLSDIRGTKEENLINEVALRSMAKAVYSADNIGHFGLAFDHYSHFTSPIRRYPDLLVHRLLWEYTGGMAEKRRSFMAKELPGMCKHCSEREKVAAEAERDSVKVMQVEYMRQHIGAEFQGIISGVIQWGVFVEINDILVEGLLHVRDLNDDYYVFDEKQYALIGERKGKRLRLGDSITVKVASVVPERRQIDFIMVESDITEGRRKGKEKGGTKAAKAPKGSGGAKGRKEFRGTKGKRKRR
ncbi:MAG: ribonuclease R [Bacteroidetes bacterium]|nr:ribonuclease R [Bacteroidota bacterium]